MYVRGVSLLVRGHFLKNFLGSSTVAHMIRYRRLEGAVAHVIVLMYQRVKVGKNTITRSPHANQGRLGVYPVGVAECQCCPPQKCLCLIEMLLYYY